MCIRDRDTGASVENVDQDFAIFDSCFDRDLIATILAGIVEQIGKCPCQSLAVDQSLSLIHI